MNVCVLGMGKIGHGTAAALVNRGHKVTCFTRCPHKAQALNNHGITASGALCGIFPVQATTRIDAAEQADLLVVTTTAQGHRPMAELLQGHLKPNQMILILTGNWGAYEFYCVLGEEARTKNVIIGETSGNIAAVPKLSDPATVFIKPAKRTIDFATIPASKAPWMAQELRDAFPQLRPVKNVLTTSLNSTNPPIHVPVSLFNITRIANREDALFYQTGLPPVLSDFLAAADGERVAVGKAVGAEVSPVLELMNRAWQSNYEDLRTMGMENESLKSVLLPKDLKHRFLTEDIPFGLWPVARLGAQFGVPTPRTNLMIEAYRYLLNEGEEVQGPRFDLPLTDIP